jgi:hypothetical protein
LFACTGKPTVSKRCADCQATLMLGFPRDRMTRMTAAVVALGCAMPAAAQVDQARADTYFR